MRQLYGTAGGKILRIAQANNAIESAIAAYGAQLWIDADDLEPLGAGTVIASWVAREGVAPTQAVNAERPVVDPDGWAGRVCAQFDGADDGLTTSVDLSGTAKATILFAAYHTAAADGIVFEYGNPYFSQNGIIAAITGGALLWGTGTSGASGTFRIDSQALSGTPVVSACSFDRTTSTDGIFPAKVWNTVGGETTAFSSTGNQNGTGNYALRTGTIGRRPGPVAPLKGGLREMLIIPDLVPQQLKWELMRQFAVKAGMLP